MAPLDAITIGPARARALVVWLHGLGASGDDFAPVVPLLGLDDVRFIFPHAPEQPVTINGGWVMRSWYDIRSLAPGPGREDLAALRASAAAVEALIAAACAGGIPADRVILGGFSQGGAVALELLTRGKTPLRAAFALSTYLVDHDVPWSDTNADTPCFVAHGRQDDVVPVARGRAAHDALAAAGRTVSWQDYPMAHAFSEDELVDLRAFLHQAVKEG